MLKKRRRRNGNVNEWHIRITIGSTPDFYCADTRYGELIKGTWRGALQWFSCLARPEGIVVHINGWLERWGGRAGAGVGRIGNKGTNLVGIEWNMIYEPPCVWISFPLKLIKYWSSLNGGMKVPCFFYFRLLTANKWISNIKWLVAWYVTHKRHRQRLVKEEFWREAKSTKIVWQIIMLDRE